MIDFRGRFIDEEAERLASLTDDELVKELEESPEFCSYLADACAPEYKQQALWYDDSILQPFKDWTAKAWVAVKQRRPDALMYWGTRLVRVLNHMSHAEFSRNKRKGIEAEDKANAEIIHKERLDEFIRRIPKLYRDACLRDFRSEGATAIIAKCLEGASLILWGGNGVGKTHLGWALARKWHEDNPDDKTVFRSLDFICAKISSSAIASGRSGIEIIEAMYLHAVDHLIIDECDKAKHTDTVFSNFQHIINRRYEEGLQTILFCNAVDQTELENRLGSSIVSRFTAKSWNAEVIQIRGRDRRGDH